MKPIKFKESNIVYAENQPEYLALPVYKKDGVSGEVVSCWKLTVRERVRILFTGKLWISNLTFCNPLQPIYPTTIKDEVVDVAQ